MSAENDEGKSHCVTSELRRSPDKPRRIPLGSPPPKDGV